MNVLQKCLFMFKTSSTQNTEKRKSKKTRTLLTGTGRNQTAKKIAAKHRKSIFFLQNSLN